MRLTASRWFVAANLLLCCIAEGAVRPRYGGTLRVQLASAEHTLGDLVSETLTRLNAAGQPEPLLAVAWQSDTAQKRWRFRLRSNVTFHDGTALTPAIAAAALAEALQGAAEVSATSDGLDVVSGAPAQLPVILADARFAVTRDGAGTGPFQSAGEGRLTAFESYWRGRPYLDAIELLAPGRTAGLSGADVWEMPAGSPRRSVPDGLRVWSSVPVFILGIDAGGVTPAIAAALSATIDREPMATALAQRRAEPSGAILPQWLTGFAFLFPAERNVAKARQLAGTAPPPLTLTYDPTNVLDRMVAERVAVNARDAGMTIVVKTGDGMLKVRRLKLTTNAGESLRLVAAQLDLPPPVAPRGPESVHAAERALIDSGRFIPLMHVPLVFGFHPKVRFDERQRVPRLALEDVWIAP